MLGFNSSALFGPLKMISCRLRTTTTLTLVTYHKRAKVLADPNGLVETPVFVSFAVEVIGSKLRCEKRIVRSKLLCDRARATDQQFAVLLRRRTGKHE